MSCIICENLEREFKTRQKEYFEARSAAYYQVSRKFAASRNVEMERAKIDLEDHRLICASAHKISAFLPAAAQPCITPQETLQSGPRITVNRAA